MAASRDERLAEEVPAAQAALAEYQRRRDFQRSPEPGIEPKPRLGRRASGASAEGLRFVIQKHAARRLHYDFRLELDGVLKSWAVPKGPSLDPKDKRLAVPTEDHPLAYADFEGEIPQGEYGAGHVLVWDQGRWTPEGDAHRGLAAGKLAFTLQGHKLQGRWALVRLKRKPEERKPAWLLIKELDDHVASTDEPAIVDRAPDSVLHTKRARHTQHAKPAHHAKPARTARRASTATADVPESLAPQLATLVEQPAEGEDWRYEMKFDGYRLLTRLGPDGARCLTRNGHDWTAKLGRLSQACAALDAPGTWLDGEIVVHDAQGLPDFQALQQAFLHRRADDIVYWLFDLPFLRGEDLRARPLRERRALLASLLEQADADGPLRMSTDLPVTPGELLAAAEKAGLEGLIGKRQDAPYRSQRSPDWIKLKTRHRQEFVIGGWTEPQGSRQAFGSLLLGLHDERGRLHYAGLVGSGFDDANLGDIHRRLCALARRSSPFVDAPARVGTTRKTVPHWIAPELLAEVSFAQWTRDRKVRHAVFHGLREDKPARGLASSDP